MEVIKQDYALKDISILSWNIYIRELVDKINIIFPIRWKTLYFDFDKEHKKIMTGPEWDNKLSEIFKSTKTSSTNPLRDDFEDEHLKMVTNIEFRKHPFRNTPYQTKLRDKIKELKRTDRILVHGDKTSNLCLLNNDKYHSIIQKEILENYKVVKPDVLDMINQEAKSIIFKYNLEDKVEPRTLITPKLTLKYHKENILLDPKVRLICPYKSDIGKRSKNIIRTYPKLKTELDYLSGKTLKQY